MWLAQLGQERIEELEKETGKKVVSKKNNFELEDKQ